MSLESDYFKRKSPVFEALIPYGFTQEDDTYCYQESFMEGDFKALITIKSSGQLSARVIDTDLGEDYLPLRNDRQQGVYVGQVRQAYLELLGRLSAVCFRSTPFQTRQANQVATSISQQWNDPLDYPFEKFPNIATYRVSGKWYAMVLPLLADKLGQVPKVLQGQMVEVLTVRIAPNQLTHLLQQRGVYPAYHMSKKTWISLLLDGTLADDQLWELVTKSRQLANPNGLANPDGPDYWVIPANLSYYDIDAEFAANPDILWTQKASIKAGDYVFIYITAPTRSIRYACQVLRSDIPNQGYRKNAKIKTLMSLRLLHCYEDGLISLDLMKQYGVNAVRGPRRLSPQLVAFLKEKEYFKDVKQKE